VTEGPQASLLRNDRQLIQVAWRELTAFLPKGIRLIDAVLGGVSG
jgi:hypothetical protein